jgi:hypothetical protein
MVLTAHWHSIGSDPVLTFSMLLTAHWHSIGSDPVPTFSMVLTAHWHSIGSDPYWHSVCYWQLTDIQLVVTPYWHSVCYWLHQSILESWLTSLLNETKYSTPKPETKWYPKLHEWSQRPSVSEKLNFSISHFLKTLPLSVYGPGCGLYCPGFEFR